MSRTTRDDFNTPWIIANYGETLDVAIPGPEWTHPPESVKVLSGLRFGFGTDNADEHAGPSTMTFQILVSRSIADIPTLFNGQHITIKNMGDNKDSWWGRIRRMSSTPHGDGGLLVTIVCTDYLSDLEEMFVSCNLPAATTGDRASGISALFTTLGEWVASTGSIISNSPRALQRYNSIKPLTLLDRFLAPTRGRRFLSVNRTWTSPPGSDGYYNPTFKMLTAKPFHSTARPYTLDTAGPTSTEWIGAITREVVGYEVLNVSASNIHRDIEWTIAAETVKTRLGLVTPDTPAGSNDTATTQHDYNLSAEATRKYGVRSVNVETDLEYNGTGWASTVADVKTAWLDVDQYWQPGSVRLVDSSIPAGTRHLVNGNDRPEVILNVSGVMPNTPTPGIPFMQACIMGGELVWNGEQWETELSLYKPAPIPRTPTPITFAQIAASPTPTISAGTGKTIGRALTFDAFSYIPSTR